MGAWRDFYFFSLPCPNYNLIGDRKPCVRMRVRPRRRSVTNIIATAVSVAVALRTTLHNPFTHRAVSSLLFTTRSAGSRWNVFGFRQKPRRKSARVLRSNSNIFLPRPPAQGIDTGRRVFIRAARRNEQSQSARRRTSLAPFSTPLRYCRFVSSDPMSPNYTDLSCRYRRWVEVWTVEPRLTDWGGWGGGVSITSRKIYKNGG